MDLTSGTRTTTGAGAAVMLAGLAANLHGILRSNPAHSLGGGALAVFGLAVIALGLIHQWVADTSDERRILAAIQREAQTRKDTYLAAKAALENEQGRLNRDMAAERARIAAALVAERAKMEREFEEKRAELASEAFRTGAEMERSGALKPQQRQQGKVIQFADHHPAQAPERERERSRGHGVVGP